MSVNYVNFSTKCDFLCNQSGEIGQSMYMNNPEWDTDWESWCQPSQICLIFLYVFSISYEKVCTSLQYRYVYIFQCTCCKYAALSN